MIDTNKIRKMFRVYDKNPNLVYLDSAASALKPEFVNKKVYEFNSFNGVNVHRGVYELSYEATNMYEEARQKVANFINSPFDSVVFTRGASDALNLVALSYGMQNIKPGDEIVTSLLEHHSSHMPWFNVAKKKGAIIKYIPLDENNMITVDNFKSVLTDKTKVVAITYVSNVMGYVSPIKDIIKLAHEKNAIVSLDAAQAVPHMKIDVKDLDCDFLSFSGHKMCAPFGVGVLYGKKELLDMMEPVEFGGDMADTVMMDNQTYKDAPYKFETGTPMVSEVIGLGYACDFLNSIGIEEIERHENMLALEAKRRLSQIKGVTVYNMKATTGVIAFNIDGVHPHDAASVFDKNNVCIRAGHHCAQLITRHLGVLGTLRASFYMYNDLKDVDKLVESAKEAVEFFGQF